MNPSPNLKNVSLSPEHWANDYARFLAAQGVDRTTAGRASGDNGAVTVAYNGLAARAGLEALKQGGNAIDAALTAALTQVALTAGAPISYFGIMTLVYFDAATRRVHTMNAEWNTVRGETEPLSIPGGFHLGSAEGRRGLGAPSGRTAMVGGFMKGVGAAHARFGSLPLASLFEPAIHVAATGMPVTRHLAEEIAFRSEDFSRLPETRAVFTKADGAFYGEGDLFKQTALAQTLKTVAAEGVDYLYKGEWARKLVEKVQSDGGKMTLEDLAAYEAVWADPMVAPIPGGYSLQTSPPPNGGGVNLVEALNLAAVAKVTGDGPWWKSGLSLRKAMDVTSQMNVAYLPDALVAQVYPGMDFSPASRVTPAHAEQLWARMEAGAKIGRFTPATPRHSDDVVAVDRFGNMAAICHSINTVFWGKTGIFVDGISISDAASFQQAAIAKVKPGERLPAPTEVGIVLKGDEPVLAFASMGAGLHVRSFQCLTNFMEFGLSVGDAIDAPDFYLPQLDMKTTQQSIGVPEGRFSPEVLDATGYAWQEVPLADARLGGEGLWVGISRNPASGKLEAASHNRNNSDAVAF